MLPRQLPLRLRFLGSKLTALAPPRLRLAYWRRSTFELRSVTGWVGRKDKLKIRTSDTQNAPVTQIVVFYHNR